MKELKHLKTFESFVNENYNLDNVDEGMKEFSRKIGQSLGVVELTDEEAKNKALTILNNKDKLDKLMDSIEKSSNPEKHLDTYNSLKNGENEIAFYKFVIFMWNHIDDLKYNIPVYYNINKSTGKDRSKTQYVPTNGVGT